MSVPWQTDYNSCSIHQTSINTPGVKTRDGNPLTLYWSWPSQRPDAVYPATEVVGGVLPDQVWSIRGPGTLTTDPKTAATFQEPLHSVMKWDRIGVVLQGTAIATRPISGGLLPRGGEPPADGGPVGQRRRDWPFNANPSGRSARAEGRPITRECDVLVIGGGPSGLAAAIDLRCSTGLDVVVAEARGEPTERFGESLPPEILVGLDRLGLSDGFRSDGHVPLPGERVAVGRAKPGHNDFILNPIGPAWHIDRSRFEAMLRARAVQVGAAILTRTRAVAVDGGFDGFDVVLEHRAQGRRSIRAPGDRRDRLAGVVRSPPRCDTPGARPDGRDRPVRTDRLGGFSSQTVVEATRRLVVLRATPGEQIVTVLVTERGEARAPTDDSALAGVARRTSLLGPRLAGCRLDERLPRLPGDLRLLDTVEGDRWLAVGDAASAGTRSLARHLQGAAGRRRRDAEIPGSVGRPSRLRGATPIGSPAGSRATWPTGLASTARAAVGTPVPASGCAMVGRRSHRQIGWASAQTGRPRRKVAPGVLLHPRGFDRVRRRTRRVAAQTSTTNGSGCLECAFEGGRQIRGGVFDHHPGRHPGLWRMRPNPPWESWSNAGLPRFDAALPDVSSERAVVDHHDDRWELIPDSGMDLHPVHEHAAVAGHRAVRLGRPGYLRADGHRNRSPHRRRGRQATRIHRGGNSSSDGR